MLPSNSIVQLLAVLVLIANTQALKCRMANSGSEADLKRVTRTCMHKISDGSYSGGNSHSNRQPYASQYHYDDQDAGYGDYDRGNWRQQGGSNNKQHYQGGNYERTDNIFQQRNRGRQLHDGPNAAGFDAASSGGRMNESGGRGTGSRGNNQQSGNNRNNNTNNNSNNNSSNNNSSVNYDENCVAHCFFEELNMLNSDDYPDKQKVSYMLTKDLRNRDLRGFYTDTIQECFHYMESQRRRPDKCSFARELVHCMSEYAKASCDDWQEYGNIVFN